MIDIDIHRISVEYSENGLGRDMAAAVLLKMSAHFSYIKTVEVHTSDDVEKVAGGGISIPSNVVRASEFFLGLYYNLK